MAAWEAIYLWHLPLPLGLGLLLAALTVEKGDSWEAVGKLAAGLLGGLVVAWVVSFGVGM